MKTTSPTHEEISRRARELWQSKGSPVGHDHDIWLEAERQLATPAPAAAAKPTTAANTPSATSGRGNGNTQASKTPADPKPADLKPGTKGKGKGAPAASPAAGTKASAQTERLRGEMASESEVEFQITPAVPDDEAIKAALQKREARAPIVPTKKNAPHGKPTESGKPVWDKPHSK